MLLAFGSDETSRVWLNGNIVLDYQGKRSLTLDENRVVLDMKAGKNRILVKLLQHDGPWSFAARLLRVNSILPRPAEIGPSIVKETESELEVRTDPGGERPTQEPVRVELVGPGGRLRFAETVSRGGHITIDTREISDGPFEVRFTTRELLSGRLFVTHLPWYKGSPLAAVRRLVDFARSSDPSKPQSLTLQLLSKMVIDRLGGSIEPSERISWWQFHSPLMEFEELMLENNGQTGGIRPHGFLRLAYRDPVDGSAQFCRAYLPAGYDPSKEWPMVIYLHGYHAPNPEYFRWWQVDKRHPDIAAEFTNGEGVIYLEPHGRGNANYLRIGERDVLKTIELATKTFSVDKDRIYLTGESMGGWGTWNIASRHPEVFAAIAPICGGVDYHSQLSQSELVKLSPLDRFIQERSSSIAMAESLLDLPIWVWHGAMDAVVPVDWSRYLVRTLQRWGYNVRYSEVPGRGHESLNQLEDVIEWFLRNRRKPAPNQVRIRSAELRNASAYWVRVEQQENPLDFMLVDAEVVGINRIRLDSSNVLQMTLSPPRELIDPEEPVEVVWNGIRHKVVLGASRSVTLTSTFYKRARLCKSPELPGSLADFINTPFAIVVGTVSDNPRMVEACLNQGKSVVKFWKVWQNQPPRLFKDTELTGKDATAYSLLLIGGPEANRVTAQISKTVPLKIEGDQIIIDDKSFLAPESAVQIIYPNPLNSKRYVLVTAATSAEGMSLANPLSKDQEIWDFIVYRRKKLSRRQGPLSKEVLLSGIFDYRWRLNRDYVMERNSAGRLPHSRSQPSNAWHFEPSH
jgi:pimeloyl-ACP methyl ester carboxylesterase